MVSLNTEPDSILEDNLDEEGTFSARLERELSAMTRVSLEAIAAVSLMKRIDTKSWFSCKHLPTILAEIAPYYHLLEISGSPIQLYNNTYYDTLDDTFYLEHQNRRTNRIKVRKREYTGSNLRFLEVKKKTNKGLTKKRRIQIEDFKSSLRENECSFLNQLIEKEPDHLYVAVKNQFKRITLVHKHLEERCTIDFDLTFYRNGKQHDLKDVVIIELKHGRRGVKSPLVEALKAQKIRPQSFSKYCIGRALLDPSLKQNALKPSLIKLRRNRS